jgi:hypothetical protein
MFDDNIIKKLNLLKAEILRTFFIPYEKQYGIKDLRKQYWFFLPAQKKIYYDKSKKGCSRHNESLPFYGCSGWESFYSDKKYTIAIVDYSDILILSCGKYREHCHSCGKDGFELRQTSDMLEYKKKIYCEDCYEIYIEPTINDELIGSESFYTEKISRFTLKQDVLF